MVRILEWAALIWLLTSLVLPLLILGSWIADQLERFAERWCHA